ncbi:hypothetical protein BS78_10G203900 [Paspalum vaginatum]|nr:hypothetical protein BS78_10G203900 [Paspalum vaginatum]
MQWIVFLTQKLLRGLRNEGWEPLLEEVNKFCEKHEIDIPDLNQRYVDVTKARNKHDNTTVLHLYKLVELDNRFSSQAIELLALCASLDPRLDSFDISKVCTLVEKYYPADFSSQERARLECQLPHYQLDVCNHPDLQGLASLADITNGIFKINKASAYPMVDRLLRLVLTLPVSTETAERAFSAMRLVKTHLRNKMGDDFLRYYMIVYIEKELVGKISADDVIKSFVLLGSRRAKFKITEMKHAFALSTDC